MPPGLWRKQRPSCLAMMRTPQRCSAILCARLRRARPRHAPPVHFAEVGELLAEITGMPRASSDLVKHAVRMLDKSGDGLVSCEELSEAVLEHGVFGHLLTGLSTYDVRSLQNMWWPQAFTICLLQFASRYFETQAMDSLVHFAADASRSAVKLEPAAGHNAC